MLKLCPGYLIYLVFIVFSSLPAAAQEKADTTQKSKVLKEVSVHAVKSAIENGTGKTVINLQAIEGNAGKNIFEVMRKLPGVTVDASGNITMVGKQGVLVTIDGRPTYLSGDDLKNYLQGIPVDEAAQIELVTQPGAQYDAEGNAGIINIKMRKLKKQGFNGNLNTSYNQSKVYGSVTTLLFNYRVNKLNLYTSINYIKASSTVNWKNDFHFLDASGATEASSSMNATPVEVYDKWNLRSGADYYFSDKTTMGIGVTGAYYTNNMGTEVYTMNQGFGGGETDFARHTTESSLRRNAGVNAYLKTTFSARSELNVNIDYLLFTRLMGQNLNTEAFSGGASLPGQLQLQSAMPINIQVWSARIDHTFKIKDGLRLESGGKVSYTDVDNSGSYDTLSPSGWVHDASRSDHFLYNEKTGALYLNAIKTLDKSGKWEGQLGLRGELVQLHGYQQVNGEAFSRSLPALFPTAFISYKPDSNNYLELNYGRRVERPKYNLLNPFNYYTFYNSYEKGNPELLPQYSHNIELKHVYISALTTALDLSLVNNNISNVVYADNTTRTTYTAPINFGTTQVANLSLTYNHKPKKWWDLTIAMQGGWDSYSGQLNNQVVKNSGVYGALWMNNQVTMGKWIAECWLNYNSFTVTGPVSADYENVFMNFGVSRKWYADKLTVKCTIDDPFYIYRTVSETRQPGLYSHTTLQPNSRNVNLALTYVFGGTKDRNAEHNSAAPDEAKRF